MGKVDQRKSTQRADSRKYFLCPHTAADSSIKILGCY